MRRKSIFSAATGQRCTSRHGFSRVLRGWFSVASDLGQHGEKFPFRWDQKLLRLQCGVQQQEYGGTQSSPRWKDVSSAVDQLSDISCIVGIVPYSCLNARELKEQGGFCPHFVLLIMQYYSNNQPRHRMLATTCSYRRRLLFLRTCAHRLGRLQPCLG